MMTKHDLAVLLIVSFLAVLGVDTAINWVWSAPARAPLSADAQERQIARTLELMDGTERGP